MSAEVNNMSVPTRVVLLQCGSYNPITNMHLRMFELARDCLHRTGRYRVIGGIMSPVNDAYSKKMEEENKKKENAKFQVKMKELVSSKDRCAMIRLALKSLDWVRLDTWECEQPEWLETLKILRHHKEVLDSAYNANPLPDTPSKKRKIDPEYSTDETDYSIPTHTQAQNIRNMNMNVGGPIQIKLLCGADLLESFATPGLWKPQDIEEIVSRYGIIVISRAGSDPERFIYENDVLYRYQNNVTIVTEWIYNEISSTKIRRALRRGESVRFLIQDNVISYIKDNGLYSCPDNRYLDHITPSPVRDEPDFGELAEVRYLTPHVYRRLESDELFYHTDNSSTESLNRSPARVPTHRKPIMCMGADISGLVRRVKNMRVAVTPETCV